MISLLDTSVWIDFTRGKSPERLKRFMSDYIFDPSAHLAEPVVFEVLRSASEAEESALIQQFEEFPMLATPEDIWQRSAALGRACRKAGHSPPSLDLLIAGVALAHNAVIVTLDEHFEKIGKAGGVRVKVLRRPIG